MREFQCCEGRLCGCGYREVVVTLSCCHGQGVVPICLPVPSAEESVIIRAKVAFERKGQQQYQLGRCSFAIYLSYLYLCVEY